MNLSPSALTALKLLIVALGLAGVFVLAALGRIDATTAVGSSVALVTGLTVALGISASGGKQAQGMRDAAPSVVNVSASVPTAANVQVAKAGQAGFVLNGLVQTLALLTLLGICAVVVDRDPGQLLLMGAVFLGTSLMLYGRPALLWVRRAIAITLFVGTAGCLSSAPTVPVTPANQAQITSCENTAALHNGFVIGDFVLGGTTAGLAGAAAAISDPNTKTTLGVVGASVGGAALVGAAVAELTSSNFQNSQCGNVVGPLPTAPNPSPSSTAVPSAAPYPASAPAAGK